MFFSQHQNPSKKTIRGDEVFDVWRRVFSNKVTPYSEIKRDAQCQIMWKNGGALLCLI